jgi:hypothetical protein
MSLKNNMGVSVAKPMGVTETSKQEFVTPKSTGKTKVAGRKVVRTNKPTLIKNRASSAGLGAHPSYKRMVQQAVFASVSRKGVTQQAIKNYIVNNFQVGNVLKTVGVLVLCQIFYFYVFQINNKVHQAIDNLLAEKELIRVEGETRVARYRLKPKKNRMSKASKPKTTTDSIKKSKKSATPTKKSSNTEPAKKTGEAKKRKSLAKTKTVAAKKAKPSTPKTVKKTPPGKKVAEKKKVVVKGAVDKPQVKKSSAVVKSKPASVMSPAAAVSKRTAAVRKKN